MLRGMPFQWRVFFGQPYFIPGRMPNMFFMLRVIPASLWVFILGTEMMTSAERMVSGR
jgi:hypothetical protein